VGKCLLAANLPQRYGETLARAGTEGLKLVDVEASAFGTTHAELGACLLGIWGLPEAVLEAVAWHHFPARASDRRFTLLTAVHVANSLAYERMETSSATAVGGLTLDLEYLGSLGLKEKRNRWREALGIPVKPEEEGDFARLEERRQAKLR
jgi:hypothetical protein